MKNTFWLFAALLSLPTFAAEPQNVVNGATLVEIDHASTPANKTFEITVKESSKFMVRVKNTCPSDFKLSMNLVTQDPAGAKGGPKCSPGILETPQVIAVSDATYEVVLSNITNGTPVTMIDDSKLDSQKYQVKVTVEKPESPWNTSISGGFVMGTVTNRKYNLDPAGGTGPFTVERNKSAEDDVFLGLAGFFMVYNRDWSIGDSVQWGPSIGFGLDQNTKISYYPNIGFRLGDLTLHLGAQISPVDVPKNGVHPGDTTSDATLLNAFDTKTKTGAFIALSFSFFGNGLQAKGASLFVPASTTP